NCCSTRGAAGRLISTCAQLPQLDGFSVSRVFRLIDLDLGHRRQPQMLYQRVVVFHFVAADTITERRGELIERFIVRSAEQLFKPLDFIGVSRARRIVELTGNDGERIDDDAQPVRLARPQRWQYFFAQTTRYGFEQLFRQGPVLHHQSSRQSIRNKSTSVSEARRAIIACSISAISACCSNWDSA